MLHIEALDTRPLQL